MKLEYPLSDVLPSVEHARDRLLARLFHYRKDTEMSRLSTDEDYALLYAYSMLRAPCLVKVRKGNMANCERDVVLVTGQLSVEIEAIMGEISRLFGVLHEDAVKLYS